MKHYFIIIAISLVPFLLTLASPLGPHTHDSPVHYARIAAYYKALGHGQILPRWAGDLNYGYGMPLFNFMYPVPYLMTSLWVAFGSGLVLSFKLAMLTSYLLSGVFMFLFAKKLLGDTERAYVMTMLYQFAPFHLIDLLVRGDMAEGFAFAFLPLVLYSMLLVFDEQKGFRSIALLSISAGLLVLSHNAISLVFFGAATLFMLVFAPTWTARLRAGIGLGLGLGISAFYWMPALVERKFTYGDLFMKDMYASHFAPFLNFLIPNVTNSAALQTGGIAVSFGLMQGISLVLAIRLLLTKKIRTLSPYLVYGLVLTAVAFFVMQPVSAFFWTSIPILRMFQFPWRLLALTTFSLSLIGGLTLITQKTPRLITVLICALTMLSVSVYFRPPLGFDRVNESEYWNYPLNTTYFGETDVIWSAGPAGSYPTERFEVIGGNGTISRGVKGDTVHTFTVIAQNDVQVVDRTQYFPGWRAYVDGIKVPIEFQDQNWRGLITFKVPKGTHEIRVVWGSTPIRTIGTLLTVVSVLLSGLLLVVPTKKYRI